MPDFQSRLPCNAALCVNHTPPPTREADTLPLTSSNLAEKLSRGGEAANMLIC